MTETLSETTHREGTFAGRAGAEIYWQAWSPAGPAPRASVVISHGVSEHSGRYGHVVDRLVPGGYAVHALDHRGHGRSSGPRAVIDRMAHAVADLDTFVDQARDEHPDRPLILLGHSLGGCIALAYALKHQAKLDALVLSAPVAVLEAASPFERLAGRVLSAVAPSFGVLDVDPSTISRDAGEVEAYVTDPLVHHGKLPARTVAETVAAIDTFPDRVPTLTLPLLVIHGTEDRLVPTVASRMVHGRAASPDKTLKIYEGLYHESFNELPEDRERVLDDLVAWLDEHSESRAA